MTKDDKFLTEAWISLMFKNIKTAAMPQRAPRRKIKPKPASQHWNKVNK